MRKYYKKDLRAKNSETASKDQIENEVSAKKHLGQHFLKDESIAQKIADTLTLKGYKDVIEIGPGMGVLTKYLIQKDIELIAMDIDKESVAYLKTTFTSQHNELLNKKQFQVVEADFLKIDLSDYYRDTPFAIIGNFPYNISTQIVFKALEWRHQVPE